MAIQWINSFEVLYLGELRGFVISYGMKNLFMKIKQNWKKLL